MEIRIQGGELAHEPGGTDIVIRLSPEDNQALQAEAALLADWFATALRALVGLRTGQDGSGPDGLWYWTVNDLDNRLLPRLEGIRDAAIRTWAEAGGTYGQLALAMDAPRSTAQSRRDKITEREPSFWESWAQAGGPHHPTSTTTTTTH
jgi:hypothetical protein